MSRAVERARAALGARFRLGGRDPATGLDCVGLVAWAWALDAVPCGYGLRSGDPRRVMAWCDARWRRGMGPGAALLFAAGPGQLHLAVATGAGLIHADAGLRRVVERPGAPPWPLIAAWTGEG